MMNDDDDDDKRWRTFLPKSGTLSLLIFEVFDIYATDGETYERMDRRTDKQTKATLIAPSLRAGA